MNLGTQTIGAVAGFSRGFIAGCGGTVHVYEYIQGSWRRAKVNRNIIISNIMHLLAPTDSHDLGRDYSS